MSKLNLNKIQIKEIEKYLTEKWTRYDDMRKALDEDIKEDIDVYNDIDKNMELKENGGNRQIWEQEFTISYIYTIVQTMVARLIQTLFGKQNFLKVYTEDKHFNDIKNDLQLWIQEELDKIDFKFRARDFLEDALVQRTTWLQLRPVIDKGNMKNMDFNILKWFDVWFDLKAKRVEDSDFFIRKIIPLYKIKQNEDVYINVDSIYDTEVPDYIKEDEEYEAKHGQSYYDPTGNSTAEKVELLEYYGIYDVSKDKSKPKYENVIFTLANRLKLIRIEKNDLKTKKKILLFPIRPLRQANSLIGKSVAQITKKLQYLLNKTLSLTVGNYKLQTGLLFKAKKDADIDMDEIYADGGNVIFYGEDSKDIDIFNTPNMVQLGMSMMGQVIQLMQQSTGAVDYLMGTSAGRGVTETASGIQQITEQAMYKFTMMAENCYGDILQFINFFIILWSKYGLEDVCERYPRLREFLEQTEKMLEDSKVIDMELTDLSMRRDVERTQFLNASNIIGGLLQNVGGDMKVFLKTVMDVLEMPNADEVVKDIGSPQMQMLQKLAQMVQEKGGQQKRGGSAKANPQADKASMPEEEVQSVSKL